MHVLGTRGRGPGQGRGYAGGLLGVVLALCVLGLVAGCGSAGAPVGDRRPTGYASLVGGGSVSPLPSDSPKVECIRALTAALRSVVEDRVPVHRAAEPLADSYGDHSGPVRALTEQLPTYRDFAAEHGVDVADSLIWPAVEAACA